MSTPAREYEAFLRAVLAAPEGDDLPRLVFADWLLDHGESESVADQVARADADHARAVAKALLELLGEPPAGPVANARPLLVEWPGGETVEGTARGRGSALVASGLPLGASGMARVLQTLDARPDVTDLFLDGCYLTDAAVAELAASPAARRLVVLDLSYNGLSGASAAALAGSPFLGSLRRLIVYSGARHGERENEFEPDDFVPLVTSPNLAGLTELHADVDPAELWPHIAPGRPLAVGQLEVWYPWWYDRADAWLPYPEADDLPPADRPDRDRRPPFGRRGKWPRA